MKKLVLGVLLCFAAASIANAGVRTVVFMYMATQPGQDIFIKGGHDAGLVPSVYPSMSEPITYYNTKNATTAAIKANDASLDWGSESALDWTCNVWPADWGTKMTYAVNGYGEDPENKWGQHWWKLDVNMDGATGEWYEFKAFMRQGTTEWWEANRVQAGTPYATINHWGKKGYLTRCEYNQNWVEFTLLGTAVNQPPTASFTCSPTEAATGATFTFDGNGSSDPEGTAMQFRWDFNNDGTFDTAWSTVKTATTSYSTAGSKTVKLEVKDTAGLVSSTTRTVTVTSTPVGNDFRSETIYFALTTRFYDGDTANNYYNRDRIKQGDPHWRGDFKGLIAKLDYLKTLGFTAIWITPPIVNRSGLDYHGYHGYDFYQIDPRLESPGATFQDLINAAHAKGLKIVMDWVINHSSSYGLRGSVFIDRLPIKYFRPLGIAMNNLTWAVAPYNNNLGDYMHPYREDNDNSVAPAWFKSRQTSDAAGTVALVDPKTGQTVVPGYDANRFFGTDHSTLNSTWYHTAGFMSGGDWENPLPLQSKSMAGDCIDLNTGNQAVKDYMNNAMRKWLAMGVDAVRLDTVKHVERDELLTYVNNWKAYKPGLFVFGENLVKGTGWGDLGGDNAPSTIRPWWYTRTGTGTTNPQGNSGFSVLDFSLFSTFRDNIKNGHFGGIGGIIGMDWVYGDATQLVTFFQNHDVGPDNDFKYRFGGYEGNAAMVYNLLWTIRGIPCLYYGEEVQFMGGAPEDVAGATDTLDTTGRAYFGDKFATAPNHNLYKQIQRLNQIRKAVPALQKAPMSYVSEWGGGMSFVRDYNNGASYAVVGLANGGAQQITVSGIRNGTYTDCVTGQSQTVSGGSLSFSVKAYSIGVWVLNGPGKVGTDGTYLR